MKHIHVIDNEVNKIKYRMSNTEQDRWHDRKTDRSNEKKQTNIDR